MRFYTTVQNIGNKILVREVHNGERKKLRLDYKPSLFHETKEKNTKFKSLDGKNLKKVTFPTIGEARNKIRETEGQHRASPPRFEPLPGRKPCTGFLYRASHTLIQSLSAGV